MKNIKNIIIVLLVLVLFSCTFQKNQIDPKDNQSNSWNIDSQTNTWNLDNSWSTNWNQQTYNWVDLTTLWLKVADDFTISTFADNLPWARVLVWPDKQWNYLLSRTSKWVITMLVMKDWKVDSSIDILKNLNNPHWLALDFEGLILYFAETDKLSKINLYSDSKPEKIIDLPDWWRHFTRTLIIWPDSKLYISLWSTCDVCNEQDDRIASIYRIDMDWSNFEKVSSGLRNSVFMATNPIDGSIWATEMGRDNLWDNIPPDEINIIKDGNDYGWPICYGQNIHDTNFDKNTYIVNPCTNKTPAHIELQAHSAPLWLAFIPEEWWPEWYWNDLLVTYHWSWNRSVPTWYKIVHIQLDDDWNVQNISDFITWWLDKNNNVKGRPVGILTQPWWIAYITDDEKWVIYKLTYNNKDFIYIDEQSFTDDVNKISSDITITKNNEILLNWKASWSWYFEASFPIELVDENGKKISEWYVTAQSDWMTSDYVPFSWTLKYSNPETEYWYIIFKKDNPSWLPEHDLEKRIKVKLR